jgi:hypothetical protein
MIMLGISLAMRVGVNGERARESVCVCERERWSFWVYPAVLVQRVGVNGEKERGGGGAGGAGGGAEANPVWVSELARFSGDGHCAHPGTGAWRSREPATARCSAWADIPPPPPPSPPSRSGQVYGHLMRGRLDKYDPWYAAARPNPSLHPFSPLGRSRPTPRPHPFVQQPPDRPKAPALRDGLGLLGVGGGGAPALARKGFRAYGPVSARTGVNPEWPVLLGGGSASRRVVLHPKTLNPIE